MSGVLVVAQHALRESLRRRVFVVVLVLSVVFLGLYTWGAAELFEGAGRDDAPRIVADLVAAGEQVYEVRVLRSTLEDVYIEAVS